MSIIIPTNKYQTPITDELLNSLNPEVREQFMDCVSNILFIKRLISPDRKLIKDCPRDDEGKAIIDLANPPILTNIDYFTQTRDYFLEEGCYTHLRPNSNPNSEYGVWLRRERNRCWNGMVRKSDGAWVTGLMYWYLNYMPMMVNERVEGTNYANRIEGFPDFWEGIFWRYHYLQQARFGGLYNNFKGGQHASELSRRGAHPYTEKVMTPDGWKLWGEIKIGDKIFGTYNNITTVVDIPYDKEAPYYKITLRDGREITASDDHLWKVNIHSRIDKILTTKELLEIYKKKRVASSRIPSGIEYDCFIPKNNGVEFKEENTLVDAYTFGLLLGDGCFRHDCCYFTQSENDFIIESKYIPYNVTKWSSKYSYRLEINNWKNILKHYGLWYIKSEDKFIPDEFKYNSRKVRLNILKGLFDSDGHVHGGVPTLSTTSERLKDDVLEVARSLGYNAHFTKQKAGYKINNKYKECLNVYSISVYAGPEIFNLDRKSEKVKYISNNAKSRKDKTAIINIEYLGTTKCKCVTVDSSDNCYLIGDYITTHNCSKSYALASIMSHNLIMGESKMVHKRFVTILTAYLREYLAEKDGTMSKFIPILDHCATYTQFPRRKIIDSPNKMAWQMGYRDSETNAIKGSRNSVAGVACKDDSDKLRGKRGYILFEEFGSFKNLTEIYNTVRDSVEEAGVAFAMMYLVGTSGNKESDFEGAKELVYSPSGYNIYGLPNVFDRGDGNSKFSFFFPSYINRKGFYNKDGISDVVGALINILQQRHHIKYNTKDPNTIIRTIAEQPITPAEAILRVRRSIFPTTEINERLAELTAKESLLNDVYVGKLVQTNSGEIKFEPTSDKSIRTYPLKGSKYNGALEIFSMPQKDSSGKVIEDRYCAGFDPVDFESADSVSLASMFVIDLWTDEIVAEYTGRQDFADENYEILRKLCLFYNCRCLYEQNLKGTYSYFSKMNCLYLLAETPEYLKDKDIIKKIGYGNTSRGVTATKPVNDYANTLIRNWLLLPKSKIEKDKDGKDIEVTVPNVSTIKNVALLQELSQYSPEINCDRIRALGLAMLYREEYQIKYGGDVQSAQENSDEYTFSNDDFFKRNGLIT